MKRHVLVVDDDAVSRELLKEVLSSSEIFIELAGSAEEALEILRQKNISVVLSDIRMLELSGLDLLRRIKSTWPETIVVLMTGFGSVTGALEAIREGAFDYISKPFQMDELRSLIERALRQGELTRKVPKDSAAGSGQIKVPEESLIGKSPRIVEVYRLIARAALSKSHVFISGELGTGKSLVARTIHSNSGEPFRRMIDLTQESTAAEWNEKLVAADSADLVIEEVAELPAEKQALLSRILDEVEAGSKHFRVFSLSRVSLKEIEEKKLLKSALFYRLSTLSIELPALRDRTLDLQELIEHFLSRHPNVSHLSPEAFQKLSKYSWPGNLRELKQLLERAIALSKSSVLEPDDFPSLREERLREERAHEVQGSEPNEKLRVSEETVIDPKPTGNAATKLEDLEREHIQLALEQTHYNKSKAAEILGIDRATLYRKCKTYGIDVRGPGSREE